MSDFNASGAGTSGVVPGWYNDPHDASQLRWWDGTQWTGHVAPAVAPAAAEPTPAQETAPVIEEPAVAEPVVVEPVVVDPVVVDPVVVEPALEEPAPAVPPVIEPFVANDPAPLPSRRALREAALASPVAVEADPVEAPPVSAAYVPAADPLADLLSQHASQAEPELPAEAEIPAETVSPVEQVLPAEPAAPTIPIFDPVPAPEVVDAPVASAWNPPPASQPSWEEPAAPTLTPTSIEGLLASPAFPASTATPVPPMSAVPAETASDPAKWDLRPREQRSDGAADPVEGSSTAWAWLTAISPVLAAGAIGYELYAGGLSVSNILLIVAVVAAYLLVILFAVADGSRLQVLGHKPVSWTWAALTGLVYLIVRAGELRREGGSGIALVVVCALATLLGIAGLVGFGLVSGHPLFTASPA